MTKLAPIDLESLIQPDPDYIQTVLSNWPFETIYKNNLAAIEEKSESIRSCATLLEKLRNTPTPSKNTFRIALDGSISCKLPQEDGSLAWIGYTSTPKLTAKANYERTKQNSNNFTMLQIGSGYEAFNILKYMTPYQALIIHEQNLDHLAHVLCIHDFSKYIKHGQLVLLTENDPFEEINQFFINNLNYNIVKEIIRWTWVSPQKNQIISQNINQTMDRILDVTKVKVDSLLFNQKQHEQELSAQQLADLFSPEKWNQLSIINCTNVNSMTDHATSRDILNGLSQLSIQTDWQELNRPDTLSHYANIERITKTKPNIIVLVDMLRSNISVPLPDSAMCVSLFRDRNGSFLKPSSQQNQINKNDFIFYNRHADQATFQQIDLPESHIAHLPLAINETVYQPTELSDDQKKHYQSDVVLISDRLSTDPKNYNIKLNSHTVFCDHLIKEISQTPEQYNRDEARKFVRKAQRSGIQLNDEQVRMGFLELVQNCLGDTILRDTYAQALVNNSVDLNIWTWKSTRQQDTFPPEYWTESPLVDHVIAPIEEGPELNTLFNAGKIFLHIDSNPYPSQIVLNGIAAGAFFLVKSHPADHRRDGYGQFFKVNQELITFDSKKDLLKKVDYYLTHETERKQIAAAAREKLLANHTCRHRAESMLKTIAQVLSSS